MGDPRAESPPPGSILTTEMIIQRPPGAPRRPRQQLQSNQNFTVPPVPSPGVAASHPWASLFLDADPAELSSCSANMCIAPSWRLLPRRCLFGHWENGSHDSAVDNAESVQPSRSLVRSVVSDDDDHDPDNTTDCDGVGEADHAPLGGSSCSSHTTTDRIERRKRRSKRQCADGRTIQ
jgi:hypothetical protein